MHDTAATASRGFTFSPDAAGNLDAVTTYGCAQTRIHNGQNQVTSLKRLRARRFSCLQGTLAQV